MLFFFQLYHVWTIYGRSYLTWYMFKRPCRLQQQLLLHICTRKSTKILFFVWKWNVNCWVKHLCKCNAWSLEEEAKNVNINCHWNANQYKNWPSTTYQNHTVLTTKQCQLTTNFDITSAVLVFNTLQPDTNPPRNLLTSSRTQYY